MRLKPVRAEAGFDDDGDSEIGQGVLHPVLHDFEDALLFGQVEIEDEFVVDLKEKFRAPVFVAGDARDLHHGDLDQVGGGALDRHVDGVALGGGAHGGVGGAEVGQVAAAAGDGFDVAAFAGLRDGVGHVLS